MPQAAFYPDKFAAKAAISRFLPVEEFLSGLA